MFGDKFSARASYECRNQLKNVAKHGRKGGRRVGDAPALLIWGVQVKLRAGGNRCIANNSSQDDAVISLAHMLLFEKRVNITFTGIETCSSKSVRDEAPGRVYSSGLRCRDCGALCSNDARGQRATVVYV